MTNTRIELQVYCSDINGMVENIPPATIREIIIQQAPGGDAFPTPTL
jgi:hypothetical protein